ncbi:hypothetical protein Anas_02625 [Armadillidium nasatum]|uniref:MARVEL domain-containing protein n=1 Tax=Armadillidium nasatum TaxID=96803 RepID=A0A5N5TF33_9CRUS|nr:hypothetical protein Anas_02625 [Armadillidium nasatum]
MANFYFPDILRVVEIVVDIILIGVYYGTHTQFSQKSPGDNFGQFVIIGGLIFAVIMLCVCIVLDINKKYPFIVLIYNVIWFVMYLTAGIIILTRWSGKNNLFQLQEHKSGGIKEKYERRSHWPDLEVSRDEIKMNEKER